MFWKRKKKDRSGSNLDMKDSLDAMIMEATRQGWLKDRNVIFIPELLPIYQRATQYFIDIIEQLNPEMRQTLVYLTCRYLFAKGVEGVILWGMSPTGNISVYFHPKHLTGELETEVPRHLHKVVVESVDVGSSLFEAHQRFIISCQGLHRPINIAEEIRLTVRWIPLLGQSYSMFYGFDKLR